MNAQCWEDESPEPEEQSIKAIEEMMKRGLYSLRKLKARRDQLAQSATHPNHICLSLCVRCDCVCVLPACAVGAMSLQRRLHRLSQDPADANLN